jgi:hypothetical protein
MSGSPDIGILERKSAIADLRGASRTMGPPSSFETPAFARASAGSSG